MRECACIRPCCFRFLSTHSVERGPVKAGEKLIDDDQQNDLPVFYMLGKVFIIILERIRGRVKVCAEFGIVIEVLKRGA